MDSLDLVEFWMEIEAEFDVSLSQSERVGMSLTTLGAVWKAIVTTRTGVEVDGPPPMADPTWLHLRRFAAERLKLPLADVNAETLLPR